MSCLVKRFSYYIDMNKAEQQLLQNLEKDEESYTKNTLISEHGKASEHIFVVKSGWFYSHTETADGKRFINRFYFPGDIVGAHSIPFEKSSASLTALQDGILCPFPKKGLRKILHESPKLTGLYIALGFQENAVVIDRLKAIGSMSGEDRIILLMLQTWARMKVVADVEDNIIDFPLSQKLIADALGITDVYVNRMLKRLKEQKLIELAKKRLTLRDIEALKNRCDFDDRYYELDTEWFVSGQ